MVAIVTGNALGLSTSSLSVLGQQGARGSAAVGRNGDMAYVNAATGNLVLQTQDELLVGRGLSIESLRTYNSRGLFNDDNGDNWSMGVYAKQIRFEDPTYNGIGRLVRTGRDGAESIYNSYTGSYYDCTDGDGAFDRITVTPTNWVWVDGSTGLVETYDKTTGRLLSVADKSGNTLTYGYDNAGRLISVVDANNEATYYDYVGSELRQVRTGIYKNSQFVFETRVRYEYDNNRLWKVTVDLTPEGGSVADGKTFVTTYGYDGTSKRVSSIRHNNDTVLRVQYDTSGRVKYVYDAFDKPTEYRYESVPGQQRTRVIDPLGMETLYEYDTYGQLTSVVSLANAAVLEKVSYAYDYNRTGRGNVVSVTDGRNNKTTYGYDTLGNRTSEIDAAGNTITRVFSNTNKLLKETLFLEPNPASSWNPSRATSLTTYYVYDDAGLDRLRFVVSPEGRVTEYRYNALGQRVTSLTYGTNLVPLNYFASQVPTEQDLVSRVRAYGQRPTDVQRVDMVYDARGQLQKTTSYAANDQFTGEGLLNGTESVTQYVYDQSGRLLQTISPTTGTTSLIYDGLGRVIVRTDPVGTTTLTTYTDASNVVEQTIAQTGLKTTSAYDKAGRLVSVQQTNATGLGLGESKYAYDANGRLLMSTDPTGVRRWMLYDEAGRKVADIDGNGSLIEYTYNASGQLTRTAAYSTAVNTGALVDGTGKPTAPALSALRPALSATDVFQWNAYDKAGRLVKKVNAEGAVSETFYDGAHRAVRVTHYASRIAIAGLGTAPSPESIATVLDAARDRTTRVFYDSDGLLRGEVDAEGFLTEYRYNAAGQRNWTLRYNQVTDIRYRATGTLATILSLFGSNPAKESTVRYYDLKGQLTAEIDAENYLTEFEYDNNGNLKRRVRYSRAFTGDVSPTTSVASFKQQWKYQPPYTQPESQVTTWHYDQLNRVTLMTEPDGTVTKYDYDAVGNLVRTTRAYGQGTEERALNARYDAQGRLVAELAATEAWRLTTDMTDAQAAAVFEQYGVKHSYDKAGRRTSTSDRNGLTTLYFYNEDSQLTHSVNAMGEVEERRYNALGQLEATLRYGLRLDSSTRSQLRSGATSIASAVAAIADAAKDSKTTFDYKLSGRVASSTEQLKPGSLAVVHHLYDAFGGEIERRTELGDGTGRVRLDTMVYDRRGLQTRSTVDAGGAAIDTTVEYDAFGRAIKTWDDAGKLTETGYDKLGRVIRTVDRHGVQYRRKTTYDAFDRVLTQTDELSKVTTYTHNTAARSVTMVTPENISVTTVYNRHGQTVSITDGKLQTTSYTYDKDGNLTRTTAPIATASTNQIFERGRLIETFDANDVKVKYSYDDANRVLSREVDPDGLKLLTKYEYDSSGRQVKVTDPAGVVTRLEYDLAGRQVAQTVDEGDGRLNLRTEYTHDASGRVLTVTSPGNRVTQYKYDALGRRTEEIVDPAGLMLRTVYTYDHDGNVRTRTDANGAVSGFAYDAEGWLQYSVDGAGGVTYHEYDKMGRVTRTTRYAEAISIAGLSAQFTSADIAARVVKKPGKDAVEARSYDGDGRLRFTADGNGAVVEFRYDKNGNVTDRIAYAKAINVAAWTAGNPPVVTDASDQRLRNEYDALNRLTYQADATGAVTRREYDDNGNLLRFTEYGSKLTGAETPGQVRPNGATDRVTAYAYDKANRETWRVDATGAATKSDYDNDGNLIGTLRYFRTGTAGVVPTSVAVHEQDRSERFFYDGAGRRTHSVDAMNFVTRWSYNDAENSRTVTRFGTAIGVGADPAGVPVRAEIDQTDLYVNDKAGRLSLHTDAMGQSESYTYDGIGNKKTFTNKKGSVWTYEYDAAGRLTLETSPAVLLTTVKTVDGRLVQDQNVEGALQTKLKYDALGNLTERTEALGRGAEERVTTYDYDARGRQIKVTYPAVTLYGETTSRSLVAQTFYDAQGNAVANIDVAGKTSYKVYDLLGRVRYEVDPVGHVTGYERNTFGDSETVTRYWRPTTLPTQTNAAAVAAMPSAEALQHVQNAVNALDHSHDRKLVNAYDKIGRLLEVREQAIHVFDGVTTDSATDGKKTTRTYNAFGDIVKVRVSGQVLSAAADTYYYYDKLGRQKATVDAMGYVTAREFDANGNVTASTEFARALPLGGWIADAFGVPVSHEDDRKTTWTYDRLNRKTSETRVGARFVSDAVSIPMGAAGAGNIVTRYGYDAVGNLTLTEDANGGKTLSYYDALGRVTAVASPTTQGVNGKLTPLTVFLRDAYGNVAVKLDYANGVVSADEFTGVSLWHTPGFTVPAGDPKDRSTVTAYDKMGRAIKTTDAAGNSQISEYLANGQVGKTSQAFKTFDNQVGALYQIFEYDELGRLVATREPSPTNLLGTANGGETRTDVVYNAFGEVTERRVNGAMVEFFEYDDVGRVWRTNSGDGVTRVLFHDVLGRATAEVRSTGLDFQNTDLMTFTDAKAVEVSVKTNPNSGLRYTLTQYDALDRAVMQTQPVRTEGQGPVTFKTIEGASITMASGTAQLRWGTSLASLGAGEIRVEYTYIAKYRSSPRSDFETRAGSKAQVFSAEEAADGVDISFPAGNETLEEVVNFTVYKKDANGVYQRVLDRPVGAKSYVLEVTIPPDPATIVQFQTRVNASEQWITQTSGTRFGSIMRLDLAQLGGQSFQYQVVYKRLDPNTGLQTDTVGATGNVSISGAPVLQTIDVAGSGFGVTGVATGVLAWRKPPLGTTQVLNYRIEGGAWRSATIIDATAGYSGFDTKTLAGGTYEFELLWTPANQPLPTAHATGTFKVSPAVTEQQAQGKPNVANITVNATTAAWDTKIDGEAIAGTPTFEYRVKPSLDWHPITQITTADDRSSVNITSLVGGEYEFRISYTDDGTQTALGTADVSLANVTVIDSPAPTFSNRVKVLASGFTVSANGEALSWNNTGNSSRFEYRERGADGQPGTGPWTVLIASRSDTTGSIRIADLPPAKRFEFRITSEEGNNVTTTIGAGNLQTYERTYGPPPPPVVSNTAPSSLSGMTVIDQKLTWTELVGTTVRVEGRYAGSQTWNVLDSWVSTSEGKHRLDLSQVPPGDWEVRMTHYKNDVMVAFDSRGVKVYPNPSDPVYFVDQTSSRAITSFEPSATGLSWARPNFAAPGTGTVWYSDANDPSATAREVTISSNGMIDSVSLPAGNYHFVIRYRKDGVVIGGGAGHVVVGNPAQIQPVTEVAIGGLAVANGRLQWSAPPAGLTTRVLMRYGTGGFTELSGLSLADGKYGMALPATTAAFENYEYIVQYLNSNQEVVSIGGGVVERSPTPTPVAPTTFTPSNTRITGITADRLEISWDARPGTPKFEWRLPNSGDTWAPLELKEPRTNPLKESVSVAGQNGQFDWRISYTDAGGLVAIEYGTLTISSPQPTLTNQTASQITLTSTPGRISWTKPAGTSDPTILVREVPSSTWVSMPTHVVFLEGSLQILDLSWAAASNTEVLISYKTGDVVTHLTRGMVTTPVPGQVNATLTNAVAVDSPTAAKFSWTDLPAAGTPSFQYKLRTDTAWKNDMSPGPVVDGKRSVNITTLNGSYDYRVVYTATDGVVGALATGVLDVVQPQALLSATEGAVLKNMGADATRWSWDKPAQDSGAGTLRFRQIPGGTWSEPVPVATDGNRDYINLVGAIPGNYEYIVSYHDGKVETAFSTGTMVIAKPTLGSVDRADILVTPSAGRLTWVVKDTGTAKFQYRAANTTGDWLTLDPEGSGTTRSVSLAGLNGSYDYRLFYELGDKALSALDAGRLTVTAGVPTLQSQDAAKLTGFDTSTTQLWWNARSVGSMKVEYRSGSLPFEDISDSGAVFRGVNNRDGVDLSRFGLLNGEFRITYTDGGVVTAMAIGSIVAGGWSAPVPLPSSNVTGAVVQGTSLTWTSSHPGTPQFFYKLNNGSWVQGQMLTSTSANLAPLLGVGGTHEYRIVYSQGTPSNVSALGRGQLTVTLATASLGTAPAGRVENFQISRKTVSWATPHGALGVPVVHVRQSGGQWGRIDPLSTPNSFDISRYTTSGTWEVRVAYENGGQPTHIGIASFALSSPAITAQTSSEIVGISPAPGPRLMWTVPSVPGTPKLEYFDNGTWIDAVQAQAGTLNPNDGSGRAVFNFIMLDASTYQFRITYSVPGSNGYTAFATGRIQFFGNTAQPYVDELGRSFFGSGIEAGIGELRWKPPANVATPFQAYAAYRVASANTWMPLGEVKSRVDNTGNVHFVDISQIGQGNYEFRIHYESNSQVTAEATPRVEIKADPSRLSDALGSLGAFGLNGTQLTWSLPSLGGTPVFEHLTLSGWVRGPNVSTYGGKPAVNIQGIYGSPVQFRVRYTGSDGSILAFGTGSFTSTSASQVLKDADASVVGFKVENGLLKWDQPSTGGTATFWWQPAAGGTWSSETVGTAISVASIGSGTYNWRLVYTNGGVETAFSSGTMTVPEKASLPVLTKADIGPVTARPNSSMLQWPPSTVAGAVPVFQVRVGGVWQTRLVDTSNSSVHAASVKDFIGSNLEFRIQYSVPGQGGQPDQPVGLVSGRFNGVVGGAPVLTDTFRGEVEGVSISSDGSRLNWTAPAAGGTVTVQTRRLGDEPWGPSRAVSGTSADIAGLNSEVNEFRIVYRDANQVIAAMAMGTLVPQNARVEPATTTNVSGFQATRMQLSWNRPAGFAGMTELFQYFDTDVQKWVAADPIVDLGNNVRALNFPEMTGVSIRYRVVYKDPASNEIKALGTGTFTVGAISEPSLERIVSTVREPLLLAGRLVWERPASAPANSTAVFERKVSGIWTPLVPTPLPSHAPTHHRVELSALGVGTHEWRVKYVDLTTGFVHAIGSGTVVVSAAAQVTEPALGNINDVQADRQRVSWVAPPVSAGTLLVEAYDPVSGSWQSAMHLFSLVNGRPGADIAGLDGTVKFRISYGIDAPNGERQIMALATGDVSNVAGTASYTQTPSPVGTFSIANGELSWTPGIGTVEVHRALEGSTDWAPVTPVDTSGTRHKLTIGGLDVGRYVYRVVYKQGSSVAAMGMTGVLVGGATPVARPPASVSAAVAGIGGFSVPPGTSDIRWTRSTAVGITGATFEYRVWGTDTWKTVPITQEGTLDSVNIGALNLPPAGYEFRVQYSAGQGIDTKVVAKIQGRFNLAPPLVTTVKPTLQLLTAPAVLAAPVGTINSITWAAPSNSNGQKAVLETRLVTEDEWSLVNVTRGGANDGATFNQVLQASAFEYRITYTDAAGVVTAIGSGVMNFGNANVTRPIPGVVITTPTYTPYRPASPELYEVLSVTTPTTPNSISDPRLGFSASASGGDAPGAYSIRPKVEQLRDRWGNVIEVTDPRNAQWKTNYKWNWDNQLIEQVRPADGSVDNIRATTRIYYDALGREVGVRDAKGNLNGKVYDKAGNLVEERQADGGVTTHFYDALGNKVRTTDAEGNAERRTADGETESQAAARKAGRTTEFTYDGMGRLTQVTHGKANVYSVSQNPNNLALTLSAPDWRNITETYEYDEVGRKTKQTNGNNEVTRYRYDAAGHVVEVQQQVSGTFRTVSRTTYDANGFRASEMDANGVRAQTWTNDAFGRVLSHTDLSGARTTYTYDNANLLQRVVGDAHTVGSTTVPGQNQEFKYDQAGQLLEINDIAVGRVSTYRYDAAGNRVLERTEQMVDGKLARLQDNYLGYDAQGRLRLVFDGHLNISFKYDLNGNRTEIATTISVLSAPKSGEEQKHDSTRRFEYDAMNRQTMVEEYVENGGADGKGGILRHDITYYYDGNRKSDKFWGNKVVVSGGEDIIVSYDTESGYVTYNTTTPITYEKTVGLVEEKYQYDNLGRLKSVIRDGTQVDLRLYDGAGRAVQTGSPGNLPTDYAAKLNEGIPEPEQVGAQMRLSKYDEQGRLVFQNTYRSDGRHKSGMDYRNLGDGTGYDAAGNLLGFRVHVDGSGMTETHKYTQGLFDGYVVATETATDHKNKNATATSRIEYDANGHQNRITDSGKPANDRTVYNDAGGRALLVNQGGNLQRQLIVNGEVLGNYGIGLDDLKPKDSNRNPVFAPHVDFEWGFQSINGNYPGASPGSYTVRQGDTLQGIARGAYGDSRMWYRIAEANGLSSDSDLKVGQTLVIPTGVGGVHNASDTFQPYDPSKVVGDTSPTLPVPPAKKGCGGIAMIIMIVVAVVVTVFTAGAMAGPVTGFMQAMAAGASALSGGTLGIVGAAVAGAAGSVASQLVGMAMGVQEKFSWKSVAISAISAGATGGMGGWEVGTGSAVADAAVKAAAANAMTQGIAVATGLQDKFSWKNVAASAAGAGVGNALGGQLGKAWGGSPIGDLAARTVTGFVSGATAAAMRGGHISVQQVATDAFGNALGNAVVDGMTTQNTAQESFRQSEIRDQNLAADRQWYAQSDAIQGRRFTDKRDAEWVAQSDAIQQRRMGEAAAPYREQQWIDQSDAIQRQRMATASADVAQENFRALERQYRQATDAGAKATQVARMSAAVWTGGAGGGRGFVNPAPASMHGAAFAGRSTVVDPAAYVDRRAQVIAMSNEPAENYSSSAWKAAAQDYKRLAGKGFSRDSIYNGLWTKGAQLDFAAGNFNRGAVDEVAGVGIEAGTHAEMGVGLGDKASTAAAAALLLLKRTQRAPSPLLPGEGNVGTYDELISAGTKGDNITPHHIPSARHMAQHGVSKGDGIAINMEMPSPGTGGRHRETFTYGSTADVDMTARDALAAGVRDARAIYQKDGLYDANMRQKLQELIRQSKVAHPDIFRKQ